MADDVKETKTEETKNTETTKDNGQEGKNSDSSKNTNSNQSQGKTFSEDYVHDLREEAKSYRLGSKELEGKLKTFKKTLGFEEDQEIDEKTLDAFRDSLFEKANNKLFKAELKLLENDNYNSKLLERLIDKKKLEFTDDGELKGLKEQLETLEEEFPEIKKTEKKKDTGANPPPKGTLDEIEDLKKEYEKVEKSRDQNKFIKLASIARKIKELKS